MVVFKSKAYGDIYMYEENAEDILRLFEKDISQGIITVEELDSCIEILEKEVARTKLEDAKERQAREKEIQAEEEELKRAEEDKRYGLVEEVTEEDKKNPALAFDDQGNKLHEEEIRMRKAEKKAADREKKRQEREKAEKRVTFSSRAYPFMQMLLASKKKQKEIVWGV